MDVTLELGTLGRRLYNKVKIYTRVVWKHLGINHTIRGSRGGVNKKRSIGVVISHRDRTAGGYWSRLNQCGANVNNLAKVNTSVQDVGKQFPITSLVINSNNFTSKSRGCIKDNISSLSCNESFAEPHRFSLTNATTSGELLVVGDFKFHFGKTGN